MKIIWNTDANAPCCPGEILNDVDNRSILIQTDWDYPGVASTFGWNIKTVQNCPECGVVVISDDETQKNHAECDDVQFPVCDHDGTDGTVDCRECGIRAGQFIELAGNWLSDNDGAAVDDPGYFDECE